MLNAGDAVVDDNTGETLAVKERRDSDAGDAPGNRHALQAPAILERSVIKNSKKPGNRFRSYVSDSVGDRDIRQAGAAKECPPVDFGYAVGNRDAGQAGAAGKRIRSDVDDAAGDCNGGQVGAAFECAKITRVNASPNVGHAVWDRDICQANNVVKCFVTDDGDGQVENCRRDYNITT